MTDLKDRMDKSVEALKGQLASFRTGRANPDLLSRIMVSCYGSMVPLKQLANITVPDNRVLQISVFDKTMVKDVDKAIQLSDLGMNPSIDGSTLRLRLPELTEDRRKDLVKQVKKVLEEAKISLRNIRRDAVDDLKKQEKAKELPEDESKRLQEDIQKLTDKYITTLESLVKDKETEIMTL
jgi:ribosome recycling factor